MVRDQQGQKSNEIVGSRRRQADFHQQGFEIFLGALLAVEATRVRKGIGSAPDLVSGAIIGFGLSDPFARHFFHKGPGPGP